MVFRTYSDNVLLEGDNIKHFECKEAVLQGQLVELDTNDTGRTIEPSDADGGDAIGFVLYDGAIGEEVAVAMDTCIVRATSGTGTISAGDRVASHGATGEEGEVATAASGDHVVGVAVEDDGGDGGDAIVYIQATGHLGA